MGPPVPRSLLKNEGGFSAAGGREVELIETARLVRADFSPQPLQEWSFTQRIGKSEPGGVLKNPGGMKVLRDYSVISCEK